MKVCFKTFGCRLNKAEALQQEAEYLAKGWQLTDKHSEAHLFVVRGCSVTARAQFECEKLISHLRRHYPLVPIKICGCLKKSSPRSAPSESVKSTSSDVIPTRTARAYLKVQDGCSGHCTFCIVPQFRGKSTSVPFDELLDRDRRFIDADYHEIVVTGCNLSLYASQGRRLPELLAALAELNPDCRIRLGSMEPGDCATETVHAIAEHDNLCRFLHLPIQSGSQRILTAMRRPYSVDDIESLLELIHSKLPDIGLGCDIMTGFPGENELDHAATKGLLKRHSFSNAHIFPYSERPDTIAAGLPNAVAKSIRTHRAHELSRITDENRRIFARKFIGKTVRIVVESESRTTGWTSEYLPCEAVGIIPRKHFATIAVTQYLHGRLRGRLVKA